MVCIHMVVAVQNAPGHGRTIEYHGGRIEELLAMIEDLEKRAAMAAHNLAVAAEQKAENIP